MVVVGEVSKDEKDKPHVQPEIKITHTEQVTIQSTFPRVSPH